MRKVALSLTLFFLLSLLLSCGRQADGGRLSVTLLSPYAPAILAPEAQPGDVLTKQKVQELNDRKTKTFTEYLSYGDYFLTLNYDRNQG